MPLFVVGVELLAARYHALVERVRLLPAHFDHDGLRHLGGDHFADQGLAMAGVRRFVVVVVSAMAYFFSVAAFFLAAFFVGAWPRSSARYGQLPLPPAICFSR